MKVKRREEAVRCLEGKEDGPGKAGPGQGQASADASSRVTVTKGSAGACHALALSRIYISIYSMHVNQPLSEQDTASKQTHLDNFEGTGYLATFWD